MIIEKEENGKRTVTVFEPVLVYEIDGDVAWENSIAGRRRVAAEFARRQIQLLRERELGCDGALPFS